MSRIGILTCSNPTQDLGCSSASCLSALRKRRGAFDAYPASEPLDLVGIINCPGCPTLTGTQKLTQRIKSLTEYKVDAIHFSYCMLALCPFKTRYKETLEATFSGIKIVMGTHPETMDHDEFRKRVARLFEQQRKGMTDVVLGRD